MSIGVESPDGTVGIVGVAGDLGGHLAVQAVATEHEVFGLRQETDPASAVISGIDPKLSLPWAPNRIRYVERVEDLLEAPVVHWCAPIEALEPALLTDFTPDHTLVLHDSVMANSLQAKGNLERARFRGQIAVVHCLMNEQGRVVVADCEDEHASIMEHFRGLRLNPLCLPSEEHDLLMAHTQAPLAILHSLLIPRLDEYGDKGLLTPSGEALRTALKDRAIQWTDATFATILSNPAIETLLQEIKVMHSNEEA